MSASRLLLSIVSCHRRAETERCQFFALDVDPEEYCYSRLGTRVTLISQSDWNVVESPATCFHVLEWPRWWHKLQIRYWTIHLKSSEAIVSFASFTTSHHLPVDHLTTRVCN